MLPYYRSIDEGDSMVPGPVSHGETSAGTRLTIPIPALLGDDDDDPDLDSSSDNSDGEYGEDNGIDDTGIQQIINNLSDISDQSSISNDRASSSNDITRTSVFKLPQAAAALIQLERYTKSHVVSLQEVGDGDVDDDADDLVELQLIELESNPKAKAKMQKLYNKTRHLPVNVRSANRQIGKLKMEWITNFKSLKFMSELLFAAYKYVLTKDNSNQLFEKNALTKLVQSELEMLRLSVEPFNELNGNGNLVPLLEQYPKLTTLFMVGGKKKIVRASFFLLSQYIHLKENRPDVLKQLGLDCTKTNECSIEHFNSIIGRAAHGLDIDANSIRKMVVQCEKASIDYSIVNSLIPNRRGGVKKNVDSEIRKQVYKYNIYICIYVCMYVCMYVCIYVCM